MVNKYKSVHIMEDKGRHIEEDVWNEIGVDASFISEKFKRMSNPCYSVAMRISESLLRLIKHEFSVKRDEKIDVIKELWKNHSDFVEFLHLIIWYANNKMDENVAKDIYELEFKKHAPEKQTLLYKSIREKPDSDILRKMHYTNLIQRKTFLTCSIGDKSLKNENISKINEKEAEEIIKAHVKKPKKNKINVWYVLKTKDGVAVFVYVNAKSRKQLPSTHKKRNHFLRYSKPLIVYLTNETQKLHVYSNDVDTTMDYASALISKYDKPQEAKVKQCYWKDEFRTENSKSSIFIDSVINEKDEQIKLMEIKFYPDKSKYDSIITISKQSDDIKDVIKDQEEYYGVGISNKNIISATVVFGKCNFIVSFGSSQENSCVVTYGTRKRSFSDIQAFVEYMKKTFDISLNKRSK